MNTTQLPPDNNAILMEWMRETVTLGSTHPDYEAYIILNAEDDVELHRAILNQRLAWGADNSEASMHFAAALMRQKVQLDGIESRRKMSERR